MFWPQLVFIFISICAWFYYFDQIFSEIHVTKNSFEGFLLLLVIGGFLAYLFICTLTLSQDMKIAHSTTEYEVNVQQSMSQIQQTFVSALFQSYAYQATAHHQTHQTVQPTTLQDQLTDDDRPPTYHQVVSQIVSSEQTVSPPPYHDTVSSVVVPNG